MKKPVRNAWLLSLMVLAALGIGGCAHFEGPNWFHPGTVEEQRKRAERFDPYPDNTIAPEVVGGRPREFANPLAEPEHDRRYAPMPGLGP